MSDFWGAQALRDLSVWLESFSSWVPLSYELAGPEGEPLASAGSVEPLSARELPLVSAGQRLGTFRYCVSEGLGAPQLHDFIKVSILEWTHSRSRLQDLSRSVSGLRREVSLLRCLGDAPPAPGLETNARIMLDRMAWMFGAQRASIFMKEKAGMRLLTAVGFEDNPERPAALEAAKKICGFVSNKGSSLIVNRPADLPEELREGPKLSPYMVGLPLHAYGYAGGETVLGAILLEGRGVNQGAEFSDLRNLMTLASHLSVRIRNLQMSNQIREAEWVQQEMDLAARLQRNFLPQHTPKIAGLDLAGLCIPARWVGGDYYDWAGGDDGSLHFAVADVSGHGMSSALLMSTAHSMVKSMFWNKASPVAIANSLNLMICRDAADSGMFITGFFAHYTPSLRRLEYVSAGHVPSLLIRPGQKSPELLESGNLPAGIDRSYRFTASTVEFGPGETLVLRTDGIDEALNCDGVEFGEQRFLDAVAREKGGSSKQIVNGVRQELETFLCGVAPQDDITLVAIRHGLAAGG